MKVKIRWSLLLIIAAFAAAVAVSGCSGSAPEPGADVQFKATLVIGGPEGSDEYLVNFTRDRQRVELVPGGATVILRLDRGVTWTLMRDSRLFLERPIEPGNKNPLVYQPDEMDGYEKLGEETVDGHPVIKERFVMKNAGDEPKEVYRWFATDVGWPLKAQAVDGSWALEYRDVEVMPQDPGLFEVPEGYSSIAGQQPHAMPRADKGGTK